MVPPKFPHGAARMDTFVPVTGHPVAAYNEMLQPRRSRANFALSAMVCFQPAANLSVMALQRATFPVLSVLIPYIITV